jgi:hypothetical protein
MEDIVKTMEENQKAAIEASLQTLVDQGFQSFVLEMEEKIKSLEQTKAEKLRDLAIVEQSLKEEIRSLEVAKNNAELDILFTQSKRSTQTVRIFSCRYQLGRILDLFLVTVTLGTLLLSPQIYFRFLPDVVVQPVLGNWIQTYDQLLKEGRL